jgi:hypothetical protein
MVPLVLGVETVDQPWNKFRRIKYIS